MSTCTLPIIPPFFDATQWRHDHPAPQGYTETKFDFADVSELIQTSEEDYTVTILGTTMVAINLDATGSENGNHPIYFELDGRTYHYVFCLWANRVTIEVAETPVISDKTLSVMFPSTLDELRLALSTVVGDMT